MTLRETRESGALAEMALATGSVESQARPVFAEWLRTDPPEPTFGSPLLAAAGAWWAQRRDTASLREMARRAGAVTQRDTVGGRFASYSAALANAYLALARGDTVRSLQQFAALPDSLCELCAVPRFVHARLLASTGRLHEAAAILTDRPTLLPSAIDVLWALERARVADRLGDSATARQGYAVVGGAWQAGDAELAPVVAEARTALRRLAR